MPSLSSPLREAGAHAMTGPAAPLERLRQTARREINRHVNVNGRCGVSPLFSVRAGGAARNGTQILLEEFLDERRQEHIGATSIRRRGLR